MCLPIIYANPREIDTESGSIGIDGPEARHLTRSLRVREGDPIVVGDGAGARYAAGIASINPRLEARIESVERVEKERPEIFLFQALSKPVLFDENVQRAAESGAAGVVPFLSSRSPETAAKAWARLERWRRLGIEVSKVARRAWPLEVENPKDWPGALSALQEIERRIVLWEGEGRNGLGEMLPGAVPRSIGVVVGPPGGLNGGEVEELRMLGCVAAGLGELILRSETAGPYAVMIVRFRYGLLGSVKGR